MQAADLLEEAVQQSLLLDEPGPKAALFWQYRKAEALHWAGRYEEEAQVLWQTAKDVEQEQQLRVEEGEGYDGYLKLLCVVYHAMAAFKCRKGNYEEAKELLQNALDRSHDLQEGDADLWPGEKAVKPDLQDSLALVLDAQNRGLPDGVTMDTYLHKFAVIILGPPADSYTLLLRKESDESSEK